MEKSKRFSRDKLLRSASKPRKWFNVEAESDVPAVYIYDAIGMDFWGGGVTPSAFIDEVRKIKTDAFDLHINSVGGFVYDGFAIYNFLNRLDKKITVYIDGICASIASVIAMVGDEIIIPENGEFMIHDPWGIMIGSAEEFRKEADQMDSLKESIIGIYEARTKLKRETLDELMSDETYIKGEQALEWGFADVLEAPKQMVACAFDTLFSDGENDDEIMPAINKKRNLEKSLREAGWSKTESVAIANGVSPLSNANDGGDEEIPLTIIMR